MTARRHTRRTKSTRPSTAPEKPRQPLLPTSMLVVPEVETEDSLSIDLDALPPPFPLQKATSGRHTNETDWATFITAYACGRWDPHRTPKPPRTQLLDLSLVSVPSGPLAFERARPPPPPPSHRLRASFSAVSSGYKSPSSIASSYPVFSLPGVLPTSGSSYPPVTSSTAAFTVTAANATTPTSSNHYDAQTSAATLRWAAARVRVAPLALPSPEHELVDPMRNAGAVPIPGSHPDFSSGHRSRPSQSVSHSRSASITRSFANLPHLAQTFPVQTPNWDVMTPGGTRRARLSGFWSGTADVGDTSHDSEWLESNSSGLLPAFDASPTTPEDEESRNGPTPTFLLGPRPPPATAPVRVVDDEGDWDYFAIGAEGSRSSGRGIRRDGLNTPPSTRHASVSRPEEPERSEVSVQTPTTPDSNPKRVHNLSASTTSLKFDGLDLSHSGLPIALVDTKDEVLPIPAPTPIFGPPYRTSSTPPPPANVDITTNSAVPVVSESVIYPTPDDHPLLTHASDTLADLYGLSGGTPHPYSVPAARSRRAQLTRQASAPLPISTSDSFVDIVPVAPRAKSTDSVVEDKSTSPSGLSVEPDLEPAVNDETKSVITDGQGRRSAKEDVRAAREDHAFSERGFLAPPFPPDELGRRRALYKFNIVNTGSDMNFDRIAHLAKLVFNTKGVLISVVDEAEEWFKSEWGVNKLHGCAREASFGAHAILQRGDEPMIILDTHLDWRFTRNPLVVGAPHIRFYAAAPLRTQDGFNIGCLALIDDAPRADFTPRQRHTLKEFAAIAMREMELWRDKIRLRIRDRIQNSMEQFSRECLEIDESARPVQTELSGAASIRNSRQPSPTRDARPHLHPPAPIQQTSSGSPVRPSPSPSSQLSKSEDFIEPSSSMDQVYARAAKLVQHTLDVDGAVVIDVSHCEVLESMSSEASVSVVLHHGDVETPTSVHTLTVEEYQRLNEFFAMHPAGKVSEGIVPPALRLFLPQAHIQYALVVPIYNVDKRPFALLCAWNASDQTKRFLEGHELSYLRAIGVIILSAVLKRRMILADKAKSLFISNISHELRTPLHGILAAAELLTDSPLNHSQQSFLQTVQACGNSLVETVNHVLDFTKLSGNSKAGGVENVIVPSWVDLMQLVEEAVDGCSVGHRARAAMMMGDTGIGSVYSPPEDLSAPKQHVETVVEIGHRTTGWSLKCEKGGIRRVLMNVFGNSLKFTSNGYIHVILREIPRTSVDPPNEIKVELIVSDTGKGISEDFRRNQLFHPFSQENPMQTGTGLGLAIVNSIVKSESVNGKLDVWSEEGVGTEIKVSFTATVSADEAPAPEMEPFKFLNPDRPATVSLVGFDSDHKGVTLLRDTIHTYLVEWWGFRVHPSSEGLGDIIFLNEDVELVKRATAERDTSRPFIVLSMLHGNPAMLSTFADHENIGGFCRPMYKPGGPSKLQILLKLALHAVQIAQSGRNSPHTSDEIVNETPFSILGLVPRRNSEETRPWMNSRPLMSPRASTVHPLSSPTWRKANPSIEERDSPSPESDDLTTITIGGPEVGTLLKASVGTIASDERRFRVLVVEDNNVLRMLLIKWLTSKGYEYRDAVDGRNGVRVYEEDGPFDVVLLDMSMPILDGIGATMEIREMEARRQIQQPNSPQSIPARILALTGRSSLEDKRRAFDAGVDGYLVKPVAFKTLDEIFSKLGVSS